MIITIFVIDIVLFFSYLLIHLLLSLLVCSFFLIFLCMCNCVLVCLAATEMVINTTEGESQVTMAMAAA